MFADEEDDAAGPPVHGEPAASREELKPAVEPSQGDSASAEAAGPASADIVDGDGDHDEDKDSNHDKDTDWDEYEPL